MWAAWEAGSGESCSVYSPFLYSSGSQTRGRCSSHSESLLLSWASLQTCPQTPPEVHLLGDSKSGQVNDEDDLSHPLRKTLFTFHLKA